LVIAALNGLELQIPEFEIMKTNRTPGFLSKFPLGKIPSLEKPDDGFCLTESNAIAFYLAENGTKKEQLLGTTPEERALILQWTWFTCEQLHQSALNLCRPYLGFQKYDSEVEKTHFADLSRWMDYIEEHLSVRTWLVDSKDSRQLEGPSMADLAVAQSLWMCFKKYLDAQDRAKYPNIIAWWKKLNNVPECAKTFASQPLLEKREALQETK
jgi:elongation factor 1-gamma